MSEKVRYTHHPRMSAGSPEGGRFVKIVPVLTKPRTVVVPVFDSSPASGSPVNGSRPRGDRGGAR
jgi:hypothetical protein